jgi:uncharacterized protein DUF6788
VSLAEWRCRLWVVAARRQVSVPEMVRGTVVVHRRRCGKPSCRCANGETLHESIVLSYSEGSRTRFLMLPEVEVESVRAATQRFRAAKARLDEQANAGLAELVARRRSQAS